jgi:hypothetical protein
MLLLSFASVEGQAAGSLVHGFSSSDVGDRNRRRPSGEVI